MPNPVEQPNAVPVQTQAVGTHAKKAENQIMGSSIPISKLRSAIRNVSETQSAVLITGASGTGKELVAKIIHRLSPRKDKPLVAVNCAAVPQNLFESELFGHEKGAFTGANERHLGLLERANGGTVFLDEVSEIPVHIQVKLLRALQEKRIRPVGATKEIDLDFRIVSATNRDLFKAVKDGTFREDLFYRLNVVSLHVPSLCKRDDDVLELASHFMSEVCARENRTMPKLSSRVRLCMLNYHWPGNVRELQNFCERIVALNRKNRIDIEDIPKHIRNYEKQTRSEANPTENLCTLDEVQRRHIRHVLKFTSGNKTKAAKILGVDRRSLYRKLESLQIGEVRNRTDGTNRSQHDNFS